MARKDGGVVGQILHAATRVVAPPAHGCLLAVMVLVLVTAAVAYLAWASVAMIVLAALLVLNGAGLVVVAWVEQV